MCHVLNGRSTCNPSHGNVLINLTSDDTGAHCLELRGQFYNDSEQKAYEAYRLHAPLHFLRMLSYPDSKWSNKQIVAQRLDGKSRIDILDFGCGLAQNSRELAECLIGRKIEVNLFLADIPTLRKECLLWLGKQTGIETTIIDCAEACPVPNLPHCDICFVQEFFEHVHDPVRYFEAIHSILNSRGILVTNVSDHVPKFMHVSPCLFDLRARLHSLKYDELYPYVLYQKTV